MKNVLGSIILLLLFCGISYAQNSSANGNNEIIKSFVQAFNERDIEKMLLFSDPDIRWMSVSGQEISGEASNHEELKTAMESYFKSIPSAKSTLHTVHESGNFVYALEEASWLNKGVKKSQCSMALYELSDNKIKHVWYFPAHSC